MKTKLKGTIEFKVNEEKRTVACKLVAHGKNFFGIAKCLDTDTFDVEKGKVLAQMRATLKQRTFDLQLTRQSNFANLELPSIQSAGNQTYKEYIDSVSESIGNGRFNSRAQKKEAQAIVDEYRQKLKMV